MRPCPYCAKPIEDYAQVCPFCRTNLATPASAPGVPSAMPPGNSETSGKAIGSLVCGILFFFLPAAIAAVVLGHLSLSETRQSAGRMAGRGMAIAGLVLGYLGLSFIPLLIIAAIAIPNLLRAKLVANEASTVALLRTYNAALALYATQCPNQGYPPDPTYLALDDSHPFTCPQAQGGLTDTPQAGALPLKSGYRYFYIPMKRDASGHISKYGLAADPITPGVTGVKHFFTDETGIIRFSMRAAADSKSPEVQ
jgi:type IV pilus assembly protein PilA